MFDQSFFTCTTELNKINTTEQRLSVCFYLHLKAFLCFTGFSLCSFWNNYKHFSCQMWPDDTLCKHFYFQHGPAFTVSVCYCPAVFQLADYNWLLYQQCSSDRIIYCGLAKKKKTLLNSSFPLWQIRKWSQNLFSTLDGSKWRGRRNDV